MDPNRQYESTRALTELEEARAADEALTRTGIFQRVAPLMLAHDDDTDLGIPALLRRQAE